MNGLLVDSEGFPRADIDIYAVRTARKKIVCKIFITCFCVETHIFLSFLPGLRNDHKVVMKLIEQKLHQIHAEARENTTDTMTSLGSAKEKGVGLDQGFAKVNVVSEQSPAALAVSV